MASFFSLSNLFLQFLFLFFSLLYHSSGFQKPLCQDGDRSSLLQFKKSFSFDEFHCDPSTDYYSKLSSWNVSNDCCSWDGVHCDDQTGHVIGLNLSSSCLFGSINSSSPLFRLVHLTSLDLSSNNFNLSRIPGGIRSFKELKHLDLAVANFSGQIPSEILELSKLISLRLSRNPLILDKPSLKDVVETVTNLTELVLSGVKISSHVPQSLSNLTSLTTLRLRNCSLYGEFPPAIFQLPNLYQLNLRFNPDLTGYLPEFQVDNPVDELQLEGTNFRGQLPLSIGNLKSLTLFNILGCGFTGLIPSSMGNLTKLESLDLSENYFSGKIPSSLGNLESLRFLHLEDNFLTGFDQSPSNYTLLWSNLSVMIMQSNELEGPLPIPPPSIAVYDVTNNKLSGEVSPFFCNLTSLLVLDLARNKLSGNLPHCLGDLGNFALVLKLAENRFSGKIPDTFTSGCSLKLMAFNKNKIEGEVPRSLVNCSDLEILNLEKNQMNDVFPFWLGILPRLRILSLKSNKFHGAIGEPLCKYDFNGLQIIDISDNSFTGKLPLGYFRKWVAMKSVNNSHLAYMQTRITLDIADYEHYFVYWHFIIIVNKRTEREYYKIVEFFVFIDLSTNKFEGEVPEMIGTLKALQSLNLSNNMLTGQIPSSLVNLKNLEALDLSQNELSGEIPAQLSVLTSLSTFDVSHNNLTGPIPHGNQFGTFKNNSFSYNPGLCGIPVSKRCGDTGTSSLPPSEDEDEESPLGLNWEIVVIGLGSGLVIGVAFGWALDTRKYEWIVKKRFARWRRSRRN